MCYHNIERSAFRRGEYIGYGDGVWRIVRAGREWIARPADAADRRVPFRASTLRAISGRLAAIVADPSRVGRYAA